MTPQAPSSSRLLSAALVAVGWLLAPTAWAQAKPSAPPALAPAGEGARVEASPTAPAWSEDGVGSAESEAAVPANGLISLELARSSYEAGQYGDCARLLSRQFAVRGPSSFSDAGARDEARHYAFACAFLSHDDALGARQVREALTDNPAIGNPDPLVFRPAIVARFIELRYELSEALASAAEAAHEAERARAAERERERAERARRLAELKRLASEQVVVRKNERWLAAVPFGVGQFQNGDRGLGWLFLTSEVALGASALVAVVVELELHGQQSHAKAPDVTTLNDDLRAARTVQTVGGWGLLGVAALGILQAELGFVPEVREPSRRRELPASLEQLGDEADAPEVSVLPLLEVAPGGGWLGVGVTF